MLRLHRLGQTTTSRLAYQLQSSQILKDNPKRHSFFIKDKKSGEKYDQRINKGTPAVMAGAFLAAALMTDSPSEAFILSLKAGLGYIWMVTAIHCPVPTAIVVVASLIAVKISNEGLGKSSCQADPSSLPANKPIHDDHLTLFHKPPRTQAATSNPQTPSGPAVLKPPKI